MSELLCEKDVYEKAISWADDRNIELMRSRLRYQRAFIGAALIIFMLAIGYVILLPLQKVQFVLIHQTDNGISWAEPVLDIVKHPQRAEVESDLLRYVTARESYHAATFEDQYKLINLLSSTKIAKTYRSHQAANAKAAFINRFQKNGQRLVKVQSIIFLNPSLAEIQIKIEELFGEHVTTNAYFTALISWEYRGIPKDSINRWRNWHGFTVTSYSLNPRQIKGV